jgi:hypothetical protein
MAITNVPPSRASDEHDEQSQVVLAPTEPPPPAQCGCEHLAYPLKPHAPWPNHICTPTMVKSVLTWQVEDFTWCSSRGDEWPLPHDGRALMLVLREWVHGPATTWMESMLEQTPTWQRLVQCAGTARLYLAALAGLAEEYEGMSEDGLSRAQALRMAEEELAARGLAYPGTELDQYLPFRAAASLRPSRLGEALRKHGVPDSAAIRAYLHARADNEPAPPAPLRGVLVTTLVYGQRWHGRSGYPVRWEWDEVAQRAVVVVADSREVPPWYPSDASAWRFHDGLPCQTTTSIGPQLTEDLWHDVYHVQQKHLKWLNRWHGHPFADEGQKARARTTSFQPTDSTLDYYTDAIDEKKIADLARAIEEASRWGTKATRASLISKHVKDTYLRVARRRKTRGHPTTPEDPDWTKKARAYIDPVLAERYGL